MPYYREKLLSAWSEDPICEVGFLSPKVDIDILKNMVPASIGFRAQNPKLTLRNQMEHLSIVDSNGMALKAPKFLSEKSRDSNSHSDGERRISDAEALANAAITKADVPIMYRLMEIKYSRYGVDDFDFGQVNLSLINLQKLMRLVSFYNKTKYSGLETHITNSYLNPLLQMFKFTPLFRNLALHHAASSCFMENCLLCELGFLFDMLEKAEGEKCHATNFLKAFSSIGEGDFLTESSVA